MLDGFAAFACRFAAVESKSRPVWLDISHALREIGRPRSSRTVKGRPPQMKIAVLKGSGAEGVSAAW